MENAAAGWQELVGMGSGKIIRFDETRGYGFIAPNGGGEDVFVHANQLAGCGRVSAGMRVEFEVTDGDRGPKAYDVRIVDDLALSKAADPPGASGNGRGHPAVTGFDADDELVEVLQEQEFIRQITELLLSKAPQLTGQVVTELRCSLLEFARQNGWVDEPK